MKRKYINPSTEIIRYDMEQSILAGSGLHIDKGGMDYDAESSYSNEKSEYWKSNDWQ